MNGACFRPVLPGVFVQVGALVLAGCVTGGSGPSEPADGAPERPPTWLATLPEPEPRSEPPSNRGNPATYTVRGITYRVASTARGYSEVGNASWYGTKFHGRSTSSGEPYDMYKLTAAHKTLPIPTYVRVTRLDNGRSVVVRVNDRGPFHPDRIIDLSYAAAVKLGTVNAGTARVRVDAIDATVAPLYAVQVGAYSSLENADRVVAELAEALKKMRVSVVKTEGDALFRVRIDQVEGDEALARVTALLETRGYGSGLVSCERPREPSEPLPGKC